MTAKYGLQNVDVSYCLVKKGEEESHYESSALESASKIRNLDCRHYLHVKAAMYIH